MSYLVLALKWRPQRFADVAGQEPVSKTLSNALKTNRAAQAYLFTGPRGVGKTSMARILAKALTCENGPADEPCNTCTACREITGGRALDVIEIDGASNRGIDDIRELREAVRYAPAILSRKIYIIDEVHMLTQDAFNALLKTLEEPPRHAVFIFATTEPLKVPQTILSRCQRFDFARLTARASAARLRTICESEGIRADDAALLLIARKGEGSMRDALTLLDQVLASSPRELTEEVVRESLGIAGRELFFEWSEAIRDRDAGRALRSLAGAVESGANLQELAEEFLGHLRNLLLVATDPKLSELLEATDEERALVVAQGSQIAAADLLRYCRLALDAAGQMRRSAFPRVHLEIALAEMCSLPTSVELRRFIEVARGKFPEPEGGAGPQVGGSQGAAGARSGSRLRGSTGVSGGARPVGALEDSGPVARGNDPFGAVPPGGSAHGDAGTAPAVGSAGTAPVAGAGPASSAPAVGVAGPVTPGATDPSAATGTTATASMTAPGSAEAWAAVCARLSAEKPALAALLSKALPIGEEGRYLTIGVPGLLPIHREQLERKQNRDYLLALIEQSYGRPMGVKYESAAVDSMRGGGNGASASAPAAFSPGDRAGLDASIGGTAAAAGNAQPGSRTASPERIRKIADIFGGDVIGPA